ncbi:MAG: signal peptide peptidase SppA [Fibrobacteria bacterium]|nr:signal peptide peptidase SppA [Fibrobacteria bacterium]
MSRFLKWVTILGIISFICIVICFSSFFHMVSGLTGENFAFQYAEKRKHLVVLKIEGPILEADVFLKHLGYIKENTSCQGVLVRLNSPGGAVGASQEIFQALRDLRSESFNVVVSMGNTAASGAYYIALGGDRIFASRGTITGSIGVIARFPEAVQLFKKLGVSMNVVSSGKLKDAGSMFKKATREEKAYLQAVVDDTYSQFMEDILANRALSREDLEPLADGRVLTGRQAQSAGLIDTLGGLREAKLYLAELAGIEGTPLFVEAQGQKTWIDRLSSKTDVGHEALLSHINKITSAGLFYLWPLGVF